MGEQALHRRLVVVGEVSVGLAGRNRASAGQGERRERAGMVERGGLGDHPADADPREVRGHAAERVDKGRRVSGEVAQGCMWAPPGPPSSTRRYRAGRSAPRDARRRRGADREPEAGLCEMVPGPAEPEPAAS